MIKNYWNYCKECKKRAIYDECADAYFCEDCKIWLENKCRDPDCEYCKSRLDRPTRDRRTFMQITGNPIP